MTMENFLELTNSPIIKKGVLQNQFDKRVEKLYVTKKIDFQFDDTAFTHPDGGCSNLFYNQNRKKRCLRNYIFRYV